MDEVSSLKIRIDSRDVDAADKRLDKLGRTSKQTETATASLAGAYRRLGTVVGSVLGSIAAREVIQAADAYKELASRIQLVSRNSTEFARAQLEVVNISQRTRVGLQQTGDLYTALSRSTQALGVSQDEVLKVTESINQALIISGTSAQSAQAALTQLGQGFAAGALRGEELNSVLEQAPRLAQAIADGLGVPIGKLRELGQAGELTATRVFGALQQSAVRLQGEFQRMPLTVGQATTQIGNSLSVLIGKIDEATGATSGLARALQGVSTWIDSLSKLPETVKLGSLAKELNDANRELKRLEDLRISPWAALVPDLDKQLAVARERFEKLRRDFRVADGRVGNPSAGDETRAEARRLGLLPATPVPDPGKPEKTPRGQDLAGNAIRSLEDQIRATRDLTTRQEILEQIELGRLGKVTTAQRARLLDLAAELDRAQAMEASLQSLARAREQAAQIQERADEAARASVEQLIVGNQSLREEIELIGLETTARAAVEQARLSSAIALKEEELLLARNAEASAAQITSLEREIALLKERQGLLGERAVRTEQAETIERERKEAKEFSDELNRDLKRAFSDAFQSTKNPIQAFGESLYTTINARVSAALAEALAENLLDFLGLGKGSSGLNGLFGGLQAAFSRTSLGASGFGTGLAYGNQDLGMFFAKGGVMQSPGLSAYSGQIVDKPTVFPFARGVGLMGEAGPEAILPLKRGADGKLGVEAGGGQRPQQVNINFSIQGPVDRRSEATIAKAATRALQRGQRWM